MLDAELFRTRLYIEDQIVFSRQFGRVLHTVLEPPKIFERLQYCMGFALDGGGIKVMCLDPATHVMIEVVIVPIGYPEDEDEIKKSLLKLLGKVHLNLFKIMDFSVHQMRAYSHTGFTTVDERCAVVLTDRPVGPYLGDYVTMQWGSMSNSDFRGLLMQVMGALVSIHRDGIVHRNLHPMSVTVVVPETRPIDEDELAAERDDEVGEVLVLS